ncbi:hypothetical protein VaNZ11_008988 [Volvox africanus]|uniref:Glycosyltransferase 2-like domain-containing protein n=1 Tax=Volvox africanus TaxID=51714 RepID=A0ABQ5S7W9_9CHLO|nr:hypothetical protein VaNZ11_008988 [Volvox africanus]
MMRAWQNGKLPSLILFLNFVLIGHLQFFIVLSSASIRKGSTGLTETYTLSDLAVTFTVDSNNVALVEASRLWRAGIQTHMIVDESLDVNTLRILGAPNNESFTVVPAFPGHPGALRHVLAPLFAFEALGGGQGGFKWLLVGDADTIFAPRAVLELLTELGVAAGEPHVISDFLVECDSYNCPPDRCPACFAPKRMDPRCLPCGNGTTVTSSGAAAAAVCPCRIPPSCSGPRASPTGPIPDECPIVTEISAYGGAGIIYSAGMLRELTGDPSFYAAEALKTLLYERPFGDVALAELLRLGGYGFTRLPMATPLALDPHRESSTRRFSSYSIYNDRRTPKEQFRELVSLGQRSPRALQQMVSYHVHTWPGEDFGSVVLPGYRAIARLMARRQLEQHQPGYRTRAADGGDYHHLQPGSGAPHGGNGQRGESRDEHERG